MHNYKSYILSKLVDSWKSLSSSISGGSPSIVAILILGETALSGITASVASKYSSSLLPTDAASSLSNCREKNNESALGVMHTSSECTLYVSSRGYDKYNRICSHTYVKPNNKFCPKISGVCPIGG